MRSWQLQEAKAKLSELVKRAASEGPQEITVHGTRTAVLLSAEEFARLTSPPASLLEVFLRAPIDGEDLVFERDPDPADRDTGL
jgi:prevent-host-death family protein